MTDPNERNQNVSTKITDPIQSAMAHRAVAMEILTIERAALPTQGRKPADALAVAQIHATLGVLDLLTVLAAKASIHPTEGTRT